MTEEEAYNAAAEGVKRLWDLKREVRPLTQSEWRELERLEFRKFKYSKPKEKDDQRSTVED